MSFYLLGQKSQKLYKSILGNMVKDILKVFSKLYRAFDPQWMEDVTWGRESSQKSREEWHCTSDGEEMSRFAALDIRSMHHKSIQLEEGKQNWVFLLLVCWAFPSGATYYKENSSLAQGVKAERSEKTTPGTTNLQDALYSLHELSPAFTVRELLGLTGELIVSGIQFVCFYRFILVTFE